MINNEWWVAVSKQKSTKENIFVTEIYKNIKKDLTKFTLATFIRFMVRSCSINYTNKMMRRYGKLQKFTSNILYFVAKDSVYPIKKNPGAKTKSPLNKLELWWLGYELKFLSCKIMNFKSTYNIWSSPLLNKWTSKLLISFEVHSCYINGLQKFLYSPHVHIMDFKIIHTIWSPLLLK